MHLPEDRKQTPGGETFTGYAAGLQNVTFPNALTSGQGLLSQLTHGDTPILSRPRLNQGKQSSGWRVYRMPL